MARLRVLGRWLASPSPHWPSILDLLLDWQDDGSIGYALRNLDGRMPRDRRSPTLRVWSALVSRRRGGIGLRAIGALDLRWFRPRSRSVHGLRHRWQRPHVSLRTFAEVLGWFGPLVRFATDRDGSGREALRQLEVLARGHPTVRAIELSGLNYVGVTEVLEVLAWFPNLETLSVRGCPVDPFELYDDPRVRSLQRVHLDLTPRQRHVLHAEHLTDASGIAPEGLLGELQSLEPSLRRLWAGSDEERSVLRDAALERGHHALLANLQ